MKLAKYLLLIISLLGCSKPSDTRKEANPVTPENPYIKTIFDISGFVRHKSTKKGIEKINIKIGNNIVTTDSEGKYVLTNLQKGLYNLSIQHQDWDNFYSSIIVVDKDIFADDILLTWKYPVIESKTYEVLYPSSGYQIKFSAKVTDEGGDNTIVNVVANFSTYQNSILRTVNLTYSQSTNSWIGIENSSNPISLKEYSIIARDIDGNTGEK